MSLTKWFVRGFRSSAIWHSTVQPKQSSKADWIQRTERFNKTFNKIVSDVVNNGELAKTPPLGQRFIKLLGYDTLLRAPLQGHMTMMAYEMLENPKNLTKEALFKAQVVSCVVELSQSYFLIMDDFEDQSKTRHNQPCWHLLPDVQDLILNDACMFRSLFNDILKANLEDPVRTKVVDLINETCLFIAIGQYLDNTIARSKDLSLFTRENHSKIVRYKCTYYCLELPIMAALILCKKDNEILFERISNMVQDVGFLYQMMNDYTDLTNEESKSGKTGSDIQAGKCTWFAINALERGTPEQRKIFKECYGSWDPENVKRIKEIYNDLELIPLFKEKSKLEYDRFIANVNALPSDDILRPELFIKLMDASSFNNWEIY